MKNLTMGKRAIAAITRYERAAAQLTAIKKGIVAELEKCPVTVEAYQASGFDSGFVHVSEQDQKRLWDGSRVRHHLHEVLQLTTNEGGDYDRDRKLRDDEIRCELEGYDEDESEPYKCPHCLAAWLLVERRKLVRKEFGQAKRLVRALAKSAIKGLPA